MLKSVRELVTEASAYVESLPPRPRSGNWPPVRPF